MRKLLVRFLKEKNIWSKKEYERLDSHILYQKDLTKYFDLTRIWYWLTPKDEIDKEGGNYQNYAFWWKMQMEWLNVLIEAVPNKKDYLHYFYELLRRIDDKIYGELFSEERIKYTQKFNVLNEKYK